MSAVAAIGEEEGEDRKERREREASRLFPLALPQCNCCVFLPWIVYKRPF